MAEWTLEQAKNRFSEVAPQGLVGFFRDSPLARAVAGGELPRDAFERDRDSGRDVAF